jgi:hypothetical protein
MTQTTRIKAGESAKTITLPEGFALLITGSTGALGAAYHLDPVLGGTNSLKSWAIGTGALAAPIGPFANSQKIHITCQVGHIEATVQDAVLSVTGGAIAAVITGSGVVGQPLTATLPAGVIGTLQFTKTLLASPFTKSSIAGAVANAVNSLQYTPSQADLPYRIGCDASNTVAPSVGVTLTAAPSNDVAPAVISAPVINGTPTAGAVVSSTAGSFSGSPTPTVVTTWRIEGAEAGTGVPYSAPSDSATKSLIRRDTATNTAGSVYSDSAPVIIGAASVIVAGPQLFARPAVGLFYQGVMQSTVPGTSTPITSYDCEVAYRTNEDGTNVYVDLHNICKVNGDVAETFLVAGMNLRFIALFNTTDAANGTKQIPLVKDGTSDTSVVLQGGQPSFGTLMANTGLLLKGRNAVCLIRITHEDGVSPITVPLGTPADFGATVLGGNGFGFDGFSRAQEGSVYNSATSMTTQSPGGQPWALRVGGQMYRPLAIYRKGMVKLRSAICFTDSIGSDIDSYLPRILNQAGIANVNIGSGGESQSNYPDNTTGRMRVAPYAKTAIVQISRNGFGAGLANAQAKSLALWAYLRTLGFERVIQTEATPHTSAAATNPSAATVEGQNTESNGIRIAYNDWLNTIKGTANGPDKVWPVEAVVATPDRLKWKAEMSSDYLHMLASGKAAVLDAAVAQNWQADVI